MLMSLAIKVIRAGDGWRGIVEEDGEEYARVFTSSPSEALDAALAYAGPIVHEGPARPVVDALRAAHAAVMRGERASVTFDLAAIAPEDNS